MTFHFYWKKEENVRPVWDVLKFKEENNISYGKYYKLRTELDLCKELPHSSKVLELSQTLKSVIISYFDIESSPFYSKISLIIL